MRQSAAGIGVATFVLRICVRLESRIKKKRKQKQTRSTVNLQREINQSRFTCEIDYNFLVLETTKLAPENRRPNEIVDLSTSTIRARRISRANAAGPRNKYLV